jgi:prephenate dehydrogenase
MASPKRVNKVTICGFGLIGGSIALDILGGGRPIELVAFDRPSVLKRLSRDRRFRVGFEQRLSEAVDGADVVILSAPHRAIKQHLRELSKLPSLIDCLILDTGSVKSGVAATASKLDFGRGSQFLPTHPMGGREKSGFESAQAGLFRGRTWFLDESVTLTLANKSRLRWLTARLRARPVYISCELHDQLLSEISHLPQLLSTILGAQMNPSLLELAGPGLKSMLRLAGSPYSVWSEIIDENRREIIKTLDTFEKNVKSVKAMIRRGDSLAALFRDAVRSYRCLS